MGAPASAPALGVRRSKAGGTPALRFMGSFDLREWTRLGAMNQKQQANAACLRPDSLVPIRLSKPQPVHGELRPPTMDAHQGHEPPPMARQRLGLRQSSGALMTHDLQSGSGLPHSKTWRSYHRFMESFDLQGRTRIGAMNCSRANEWRQTNSRNGGFGFVCLHSLAKKFSRFMERDAGVSGMRGRGMGFFRNASLYSSDNDSPD
jgi:hypothetical protein